MPVPAETRDVRITPTTGVLCGPHARQYNFQLFVARKYVLLQKSKSPEERSVLLSLVGLIYLSALNTQ
jgi:hypothetical protein